jgi:hypothetical protein
VNLSFCTPGNIFIWVLELVAKLAGLTLPGPSGTAWWGRARWVWHAVSDRGGAIRVERSSTVEGKVVVYNWIQPISGQPHLGTPRRRPGGLGETQAVTWCLTVTDNPADFAG